MASPGGLGEAQPAQQIVLALILNRPDSREEELATCPYLYHSIRYDPPLSRALCRCHRIAPAKGLRGLLRSRRLRGRLPAMAVPQTRYARSGDLHIAYPCLRSEVMPKFKDLVPK